MKIRCLNNLGCDDIYTKDKIYDFEIGAGITSDNGDVRWRHVESFEEFKKCSNFEWELVEDETSECERKKTMVNKKRIIEDLLIKKGFKVSLVGFHYLTTLLLDYDPYKKIINCYKEIAKMQNNHETYTRVERAIRYSKEDTSYRDFVNAEMIARIHLEVERHIEDITQEEKKGDL